MALKTVLRNQMIYKWNMISMLNIEYIWMHFDPENLSQIPPKGLYKFKILIF